MVDRQAVEHLGWQPGGQFQRPGEQVVGCGEGEHRLCGQSRAHRGPEAAVGDLGRLPVPGDLGGEREGRGGVGLLEHGRGRAVQPPPVARQQPGLEDLAEHRVPERVRRAGPWLDQAPVDGHHQRVLDLDVGPVRDGGHHVEVDHPSQHRGDLEHGPGLLGQRSEPGLHQLAQRVRQRTRGVLDPGQRLRGEQRVARRVVVHLLDQVLCGVRAQQLGQLQGGVTAVEPVDGQPFDVGEPAELDQPRAQRVVAGQVVAAHTQHEQHPLAADVEGQERHQVERRAVGPVQVLDDQHHRARARELGQQRQQRLEHPALAGQAQPGLGVGGRVSGGVRGRLDVVAEGSEPGQPARPVRRQPLPLVGRQAAGEVAQRLHDRCERQRLSRDREAVADQDRRVGTGGERLEQGGLADPRLAGHDHGAGVAGEGAREGGRQLLALPVAADHSGRDPSVFCHGRLPLPPQGTPSKPLPVVGDQRFAGKVRTSTATREAMSSI